MRRIGYGYGSEWQLMRMLGRHRKYFDDLIKEQYLLSKSTFNPCIVKWFDFKFRGMIDSELLGKDLFNLCNLECEYDILNKANWDCIGQLENIYLLGEAKGHIKELFKTDKSNAKIVSKKKYLELVEEIMVIYKIDLRYKDAWISDGFQLGNRIATQYYLEKNNVECLLLYILFIDDWKIDFGEKSNKNSCEDCKSVKSEDDWKEAFDMQIQKLGFNNKSYEDIMLKFMFIFPKCIE